MSECDYFARYERRIKTLREALNKIVTHYPLHTGGVSLTVAKAALAADDRESEGER